MHTKAILGLLLMKSSLKPECKKVKAMQESPPSSFIKELQLHPWVVNYLENCSPNIATLTVPLHALLKETRMYPVT